MNDELRGALSELLNPLMERMDRLEGGIKPSEPKSELQEIKELLQSQNAQAAEKMQAELAAAKEASRQMAFDSHLRNKAPEFVDHLLNEATDTFGRPIIDQVKSFGTLEEQIQAIDTYEVKALQSFAKSGEVPPAARKKAAKTAEVEQKIEKAAAEIATKPNGLLDYQNQFWAAASSEPPCASCAN